MGAGWILSFAVAWIKNSSGVRPSNTGRRTGFFFRAADPISHADMGEMKSELDWKARSIARSDSRDMGAGS
jgi:hypothetical protein